MSELENGTINEGQENIPANAGAEAPKEKKTYTVDGQEMSQAAYIRHLFKSDKSRGDIAKELGVPYYIVYSATANMFNAAHPEGGSTGATHRGESITITKDSRNYVKDAEAYKAEKAEAGEEAEELITVSRPDYMRECVKAVADGGKGMERGEVAKLLDCPYATVYAATKDVIEKADGEKGGAVMIVDPRDGVEKKRVDVIRSMYEEGKEQEGIRRKIANELKVDYAVVWAATKEKKEDTNSAPADAAPATEGNADTAAGTEEVPAE